MKNNESTTKIEKEKKVQTQNSIKDKLLAKWQLKLNNLLNMVQQKKKNKIYKSLISIVTEQ